MTEMSKYAAQIIINVLSGNNDGTILNGTQSIVAKGVSQGVPTYVFTANTDSPQSVSQAAANLMQPWRLYIRGHGSVSRQTLGGVDAALLAQYLSQCGLAGNLPAIVSVTACRLALGKDQAKDQIPYVASGNSYVGDLHRILGQTHGIYVSASGRTMNNAVINQGAQIGRKLTKNPVTNQRHHNQLFSKVVFYWDEQRAQRLGFARTEMDIDEDADYMDIDEDMMDIG
ncbi:C80 family cysteine peptidase [Paraburkholderia sp. BR14263]|uniref:C80 family cysteine peptidase n=2 Tax=unclassified Paraburkholderia TaxID=2615204 RepID=UPI0034CEAF6F